MRSYCTVAEYCGQHTVYFMRACEGGPTVASTVEHKQKVPNALRGNEQHTELRDGLLMLPLSFYTRSH